MSPVYELRRCMRCGAIIDEDEGYEANVDLPEFCSLCNDDLRSIDA